MIYLFLNSISTGEVIIILIFILIFFGSKNIPGMARSLGKGLRQLRDATDDIKRDIRSSVDDIERDVKANMDQVNIKKEIDDIVRRPTRFVNDNIKEFENSAKEATSNLDQKKTVSTESKSASIPNTKAEDVGDVKKEDL
jgi:sec-independent protein translocase protein TatA